MKADWPAIHIPAEADADTWHHNTRTPAEAQEDAYAKALIMITGSYKAASRVLKRNRDWHKPLKRNVDDRILLDIAHCEQVRADFFNPGPPDNNDVFAHADIFDPSPGRTNFTDNAALTKVANMAYRGKAAVAALRRLRYMLRGNSLHRFWWKRWSRFLER
jgi:hypothetical protein